MKYVNDNYGHSGGNRYIKEVCQILKMNLKEDEFIFRIGGDELLILSKKEDAHIILNMYFDELLETASFDSFCTLAHLTYPLRYIKRDTGVIPSLSPYRDKIDLIYETLIKKDKALEINVSGLFKGLGETLPAFDEIKRYHDLGGKYITLGSDAHNINDVGRDIEKGIELAFKAGFKSYYIYENCCPYEITIE